MRKKTKIAGVSALLIGLAAPAAAQYQPPGQPYPGQPYPGQPYPGQPYPGQTYPGQPPQGPQRGRFAHACFPAEQGGYLRVEWTQSRRWAVFNWPPGSNLRIYIGDEPAQWCWSPQFGTAARPCRPNPNVTKPVQPGC